MSIYNQSIDIITLTLLALVKIQLTIEILFYILYNYRTNIVQEIYKILRRSSRHRPFPWIFRYTARGHGHLHKICRAPPLWRQRRCLPPSNALLLLSISLLSLPHSPPAPCATVPLSTCWSHDVFAILNYVATKVMRDYSILTSWNKLQNILRECTYVLITTISHKSLNILDVSFGSVPL